MPKLPTVQAFGFVPDFDARSSRGERDSAYLGRTVAIRGV